MNVVTPQQLAAQNFASVYKTAAFYRRAAKEIGFDAGGALKDLRAAENKIRSFRDQQNAHDPESAYQAFIAHQAEATAAVDTEAFKTMEHWTLDEFTSDWAQRRQALNMALRKVCAEIYPTARKVTLKFCDQIESYAKDVRANEEKEHKRFSIEYQPSNLTTALCEAGPWLRRCVASETSASYNETQPSQLCPFLEL